MPSFVLEKTRSIRLSVLPSGQLRVDLPDDSEVEATAPHAGNRYDIAGASKRLGLTPRYVRYLTQRKRNPLPHTKPSGRLIFWEEDILAWEKQGGKQFRQASVFNFKKL